MENVTQRRNIERGFLLFKFFPVARQAGEIFPAQKLLFVYFCGGWRSIRPSIPLGVFK